MKGIVVVAKTDLQPHPGLQKNLESLSEMIETDDANFLYHCQEGALMTMMCALLDHEIKYTLKLEEHEPVLQEAKKNKRSQKQTNGIPH